MSFVFSSTNNDSNIVYFSCLAFNKSATFLVYGLYWQYVTKNRLVARLAEGQLRKMSIEEHKLQLRTRLFRFVQSKAKTFLVPGSCDLQASACELLGLSANALFVTSCNFLADLVSKIANARHRLNFILGEHIFIYILSLVCMLREDVPLGKYHHKHRVLVHFFWNPNFIKQLLNYCLEF